MTPGELSRRLAEDPENIARHLFPHGKKEGQEWRVGSLNGEKGNSMGIRLAGSKKGVWADFATGESGDLLDLWVSSQNISISEAMKAAKSYLGICDPQFTGSTSKTYKKPVKPQCTIPKESSRVFKYLTEKRRLSQESIMTYKVADGGDSIVFPFIHDGEPRMIKELKLDRKNGKKDIRPTSAEQEPCLFGWQAIPDNDRTVTITEGEIDAMSAYQLGFPALSVPYGGGKGAKHNWIEIEYDHLERFDTIYLCFDMDKEGRDAASEVSERLGRHRCKIVSLPEKDINACLQADYEACDMVKCFNEARTLDPSELKPASYFDADVIKEFYPPEGWNPGFVTPWLKVGGKLRFRPGEVSLIAGYNGHGKSEGTGHIILGAMKQDEQACIASLEFHPRKWLHRITRQASGVDEPTIPYIKAIQKWFSKKLWVFDITGTAKAKRILEVFKYARKRYGIQLFVIDNLSKLDIGFEDYDAQRDFIDKLTDFSKEFDSHVILVCHARKSADETKPPGKMDIKGTGALTDLVQTVIIWWRNKPKEKQIRKAIGKVSQDILGKPDAYVQCDKQNNGDAEPLISLWFDRASHQFLESHGSRPIKYVEFNISRKEVACGCEEET